MAEGDAILLYGILFATAAFTFITIIGLKERSKQQLSNLSMSPQEVAAVVPSELLASKKCFLYSTQKDFTFTNTGLIIKDSNGEEVAKVIYDLTGSKTIETKNVKYFVESPECNGIDYILREANSSSSTPICRLHKEGIAYKRQQQYFSESFGDFITKPSKPFLDFIGLDLHHIIIKDGVKIGDLLPLRKGYNDNGIILVSSVEIPLPIAYFILTHHTHI